VRPIDSGRAAVAGAEPFDVLLAAAFAAEPGPAQVARMDARLERALELGPTRIGRRPLRRTAWVLVAAAAIIAIGGAGAIALQRFEGWSAPDFDVAWERGAVLGLTDVVDGYEVTLERAYADAGQVMLAVAIEDLEQRPDTTQLSGFNGTLVDDQGGRYEGMGGQSGPVDAHETAEIWYFDPPAFPLAPGLRHFTMTLDQIEKRGDFVAGQTIEPGPDGLIEVPNPFEPIPGPWVIEFDLEVAGGTLVEVNEPAKGPHDVTVTIGSMLLTPTRGRLDVGVEAADRSTDWTAVDNTARRDSTTLAFASQQDLGDGTVANSAYAGVDDPSGTWIITIGELVGPHDPALPLPTPNENGEIMSSFQRLRGPWTLRVEVP
jgi:hypothetical protein